MKDTKALLVDLEPSNNLGKDLERILGSSSGLHVHVHKEYLDGVPHPLFSDTFLDIVSRVNPDVVFLVLSSLRVAQIKVLLQGVAEELSETAIMVVIEGAPPEEIVE